MSFGRLGAVGRGFGHLGDLGTAQASSFAPSPAPAGSHWEFVSVNGQHVFRNGSPVVALVGH